MKRYSMDIRRRVLKDCDAGMKIELVVQKYGVSRAWVFWLKKKRLETGDIRAGVSPGRPRTIDRERLSKLVKDDPDATMVELRERLGVRCTLAGIWSALREVRKDGATRKRSRKPQQPACP